MTATLTYARKHRREEEEHDSVENALRAAYWGEETGQISSIIVRDDTGARVYDRNRDGNIFDFCEEREYDWVASM